MDQRPGGAPGGRLDRAARLTGLELAGDRDALVDWLSDATEDPLDGIRITWVDGEPGIVAAHLDTPNGSVRVT